MAGVHNLGKKRNLGLTLVLACALAVGALATGPAAPASAAPLSYPAPMQERDANSVTADPIPTVQVDNGVVWTLKILGNTVYAGGSFANARPAGAAAGTNLVPRTNLLSFNLQTGALTSFAPNINGVVKALALSPDGSRLYVGGTFTQVDGQTRYNLAAFDTATGTLLNTFKAVAGGGGVYAIVATSTVVYVGGSIGGGNGVTRKNLEAFDTSGNALAWAPTTDLQVDAMVMNTSGSKLIVAGRFALVNGVTQRGLVALSPSDGTILPWTVDTVVLNGWNQSPYVGKAGIYSLSTDGNAIYGTGWVYANAAVGNLEGMFSADPESGAINWIEDCHGDTYTAYSDTNYVYVTGHPHDCESVGGYPQKGTTPTNTRSSDAFTAAAKGTLWRSPRVSGTYQSWEGYPAPAMVNWFPDWIDGTYTGQGQAGWVMAGSGDYLVVGGEFPGVNNKTQAGLVRFARPATQTPQQAPRLSGTSWVPTLVSLGSGTVRMSIPGNWDRDNMALTYRFYRSGVSQPVFTTTMKSTFWDQPMVGGLDTGLTPGTSYTYQVTATDGDGNTSTSSQASITVPSTTAPAYANRVLADGASLYWRMGSADGGSADVLGYNAGINGSSVTNSATSAIGSGTGYTFSGGNAGRIGGTVLQLSPDTFSAEVWVKTTSSSGGKLFGFGSLNSGNSGTYDRHVYMSNTGKLSFGVFQNNTARVITTSGTYRDGKWHHVVATESPAGAALYVDGVLVGSDTTIMKGQDYFGYWRVAGDSTSGWANKGTSDYLAGDMDEFSVYPYPLSASQVASHYLIGAGAVAPTASFTKLATNLHVDVNGAASAAQSGSTISSYSWDFGDGTPAGTGVTAGHDYTAAGTYTIVLTVTDSRGLTGQASQTVTVSPPHQNPTAAFTSNSASLTASVDASGSSATDGATLTYDWDWGDGSTHDSGKTASHPYSSAGDKTVTLTLTDSLGGTATLAKTVTVTHSNPKASFTATPTGLGVAVDAGASTASDGATLTYAWDWGDGSAADSGVTASHTYATAGGYTVKLTVTDSLGGSDTASKTVNVVDPSSLVVVDSTFGTDVSSGWGSASTGGAWTTSGTGFSVSGGVAKLSLAASSTRTATLGSVSAQNVLGTLQVALDKVPVGGRTEINYDLRKTSDGAYRVKVRFLAGGSVSVMLIKLVGTTETALATKTLTDYTFAAGDAVNVSFQVSGDGSTTTAKAKVWGPAQSEPSSWTVTGTDTTAALQGAGAVGIVGYVQAAVTNGPVLVSVDNVKVTKVT